MSYLQDFLSSSQISLSAGGGRKSKFTWKHLSLLGSSSTSSPLRVIAHVDLDAFYAQCESVRLGLPEDQPLAQWTGLIAVNYPAREFGIGRFLDLAEAKKLCPTLVCQHVATWREGDAVWAYHEDVEEHAASHKVSLDPYRRESRKIFGCIKAHLPAPPVQRVEKAGIDEAFLDLSSQIHSILLDRFPELQGLPPYDDPTERLPFPHTTALQWRTDALVDLDNEETEDDDPDWDDICILIGSEIVRSIREAIRAELKYTCSAGVARNKTLAKLGSAHKKPNQQTIIRNRAVQQFMGGFKFQKIRSLGGKLGDQVASAFETELVKDLLDIPLDLLKVRLGDDHGLWVYQIVRGNDNSEVNSRTDIKSMLSAKSFRPSIGTFEQAELWLRIFVADIFCRLVEDGVLENKRRPKTMNLSHRQGGQTRSRQIPIPSGKAIDETVLFELAKTLMCQIIVENRVWPCSNLSLSVGGFENGPTGTRGIGSFLVTGEEAKAMNFTRMAEHTSARDTDDRSEKRQRLDNGGIQRFLARTDTSKGEDDGSSGSEERPAESSTKSKSRKRFFQDVSDPVDDTEAAASTDYSPNQSSIERFFCRRCSTTVGETQAEHEDWHFAKDLQEADHGENATPGMAAETGEKAKVAVKPPSPRKRGRPPGSSGLRVSKGQRKLNFG